MLLDPEELQLLFKLWMLPSGDGEKTWEVCEDDARDTMRSLFRKGFVEENGGLNEYRISERGEMRLLDPFALMVEEMHDR